MKILTTGSAARRLGINKDRLFRLEEVGHIPPAKRTETGKRFFLPDDLKRLKKIIRELDRNARTKGPRRKK